MIVFLLLSMPCLIYIHILLITNQVADIIILCNQMSKEVSNHGMLLMSTRAALV
jgi:hypothetical protein